MVSGLRIQTDVSVRKCHEILRRIGLVESRVLRDSYYMGKPFCMGRTSRKDDRHNNKVFFPFDHTYTYHTRSASRQPSGVSHV